MLKDKTYQLQSAMAGYCRDGNAVELPVDSKMRLGQYRRLVFNVIRGTLDQAYPVAAKHLGKEIWNQLIEDFFTNHPCHDPQVWKMPKELIDYVKVAQYDQRLEMPHLVDLLTMEWMEIDVHSMPDRKIPHHTQIEDILQEPLAFNPHYRLLQVTFPVHKIHQLDPKEFPGNYFILIFREEESGRVQFIHLQPFFAAVVDSLIQNPGAAASEIYEAFCSSAGRPRSQSELAQIKGLLDHLVNKNFVLGRSVI